ncbi:alpha/beta hydrolase [Nocardia testacea]|uniref:alpha/beta hydrolase n=1 Tax=Nocardia testacea TaxID=248551 RepID=UPI00402B21AB
MNSDTIYSCPADLGWSAHSGDRDQRSPFREIERGLQRRENRPGQGTQPVDPGNPVAHEISTISGQLGQPDSQLVRHRDLARVTAHTSGLGDHLRASQLEHTTLGIQGTNPRHLQTRGSTMSDPEIDADYNVRNTVPTAVFDHVIGEYRRASAEAVEGLRGYPDIRYDSHSEQMLDIWGVTGQPAPAFLVIHGGYWRMLSRRDTSFMARTLHRHGIVTVSVDYGLAPDTTLEEIVRQVRSAVAWLYRNGRTYGIDPNRIVVGGSSAGGHLAGTLMVGGWQHALDLPSDVVRAALPISGLFDLRPLVDSFANDWLGLTPERAAALSPALHTGRRGPSCVIAVAELDGRGFLDQSRRFHRLWSQHAPSSLLVVPDRNHYDVFLDLADPNSALTYALTRLIAGTGRRPGTNAN